MEICPLHAEGGAIWLLARFAAGASVPAHAHGITEECLMVEGELLLGDLLLPGGGCAIDAQTIDNEHRAQLGWPPL